MICRLILASTVGRRCRARAMAIAAVALASAALLLAVAAVPTVTHRESQRALAQVPQLGTAAARSHVGYLEIDGRYRSTTIKRVLLGDASATAPLPPGLARIPAPGEVIVSRQLVVRMASDPLLADWFPERHVGVIGRAGIVTPDQLIAYVGVPPRTFARGEDSYAIDFGAPASGSASQTGARWYQVAGFGLLITLPAIVAFLAACRVGAESRRRRARAMSIAGMSGPAIATVGLAEAALPAFFGASVAGVLFAELAPHVDRIPVADRAVTGSDVHVSIFAGLVVIGGLTLVGGVISASSAFRAARLDRSNRPAEPRPRLSVVPALLFLVGVGLLIAAAIRATPLDPLLRPALVLAAAGLPVGATVLAKLVGQAARPRWPVPLLIAFRRLHRDPGAAGTLVAVVAVVAFAFSSAIPLVRDQSSSVSWKGLVGNSILVRGTSLAPALPLGLPASAQHDTYQALALGIWKPAAAAGTAPAGRALIASCAQLSHLLGQPAPHCIDTSVALVGPADDNPANRSFQLRSDVVGVVPITLPAATRTQDIPSTGAVPLDVSVIIPPDVLADDRALFITAVYARIPSTSRAIDAFRARVIGAGPAFMVDVPAEEVLSTSTLSGWLLLAVITCAMLSLVAALALSMSQGRHSAERALTVLAASWSTRVGASAMTAAIAATLGSTLAVTCGLLAGVAYTRAATEPLPSAHQYLMVWALAVAAGAALGALGEAVGRRTPGSPTG